jgi:hypothetical protein
LQPFHPNFVINFELLLYPAAYKLYCLMKRILLLTIILWSSVALVSGQKKIPLKLALGNEATAIPFSQFFTTPVHQCFQAGTEFRYKTGLHYELYQTANLGYIFHNHLYQGIYLNTGIGYDYKFSFGLKLIGMFELGYLHTFTTQDEYRLKNGEFVNGRDRGNARLMPMLSVGAGYVIMKDDPASPEIFLLYKSWIEYPYSPGFIPVMSHIILEIGCKFYIPRKNEK